MHHALRIQEILLNIFRHCYSLPDRRRERSNLAVLARTCCAFKDPALDLLWADLFDLSPLARCLPDASNQLGSPLGWYSFSRPLTKVEWDVLRSYTRRIRSISSFTGGLNLNSHKVLSNPPTIEPLFPNLRHLRCRFAYNDVYPLHLPYPSLISLDIGFRNPHGFQDPLMSFAGSCPNIKSLTLSVRQLDVATRKVVFDCIGQWRNLQTVICPHIFLDVDALVQLSRMPALTAIDFALDATSLDSGSPLFFSNLHNMTLRCEYLDPILHLLSWFRLSAVTNFAALIDRCPSRQNLSSFLASVQTSGMAPTIRSLKLEQWRFHVARSQAPLLRAEDLRPCMALSHLRHLDLDMEWSVSLTDDELLDLVSGWPHLEHLLINEHRGWNTGGGITPHGLLLLLETCRSLSRAALVIDTRRSSYTALPPSGPLESLGRTRTSRRTLCLNVLDSVIEAESVPAVAAFFARTPCSDVALSAWAGRALVEIPGCEVYKGRWDEVHRQVHVALSRLS